MTDAEVDAFRASERARTAPMREAARKESFVQGFIAGKFGPPPRDVSDEDLLATLPQADEAYAAHVKHRGPA